MIIRLVNYIMRHYNSINAHLPMGRLYPLLALFLLLVYLLIQNHDSRFLVICSIVAGIIVIIFIIDIVKSNHEDKLKALLETQEAHRRRLEDDQHLSRQRLDKENAERARLDWLRRQKLREEKQIERDERLRLNRVHRLDELVDKHISALALKRQQTIQIDAYGRVDKSRWKQEINYFFANIVLEKIKIPEDQHDSFLRYLEKSLEKKTAATLKSNDVFRQECSPLEYEYFCGNALQKAGWNVRYTACTGDQGVDIIAIRDSTKAIFQCKKYTKPVGNKAVQEAIAGREFEKADLAAVITNTTYTKSARQLAQTSGVFLLHHDELAIFFNRVHGQGKMAQV